MTDVKVEQCDIDRARELVGLPADPSVWRTDRAVIAFASHRQAAEKAQQERDAGVVKKHPMRFVGMTEAYIRDALATAIRSQGHE